MGSLFFCKQRTAYELRIRDWSSDVCSSDLTCAEIVDRHFYAHVAYFSQYAERAARVGHDGAFGYFQLQVFRGAGVLGESFPDAFRKQQIKQVSRGYIDGDEIGRAHV